MQAGQGGLSLAVLAAAVVLFAAPAHADCADPPQPGVDWRKCVMHKRQFAGVDLTGAKLKDGRFTRASFAGSNMTDTDLRRAKFIDGDLRKARLDGARLAGADFTKADMTGVSLRGTNLTRAEFQFAVLRDADFTDAHLGGADFLNADLSGATWIDGKTVCAEGSISFCRFSPTNGQGSG